GFVFVDDRPFVVDGSGVVFEGSTSASDYTAEVCYTWYDGTFETTPSPAATINVAARETVTISLPHREGLGKRVYYRGPASPNWARANVAENVTSTPLPAGLAFFQPPASNSFPNADPATLKSTNDKFEVKGDGSGHWGHFNVDTNGAMSGLIVSGDIRITPTEANKSTQATVTLPAGRFAKPPIVWAQIGTAIPDKVQVGCYQPENTQEFQMHLVRYNTTPTVVKWFAMDSE